MSTGNHNDKVGPSQHVHKEEDFRGQGYWQYLMEVPPQPVIDEVMADELNDGGDEEHDDGTSGDETTSAGDGNVTTDAGDGNGTTDARGGNVTTDGSQSKRRRKERHRNTLKTSREEVYEVDPGNGEPLLLETVVVGYGNDL